MKKGPVFLGLYSKIPPPGADRAEEHRRWHVWSLAGGQFLIQEVFSGAKNSKEPRQVDPDEFFSQYRVSAAGGARAEDPAPLMPEAEAGQDKTAQVPKLAAKNIFYDLEDDREGPERLGRFKTVGDEKPEAGPAQTGKYSAVEEYPLTSNMEKLEEQLRSDFSLALIRLRTNRDNALESLNKILNNSAKFDKKHKFMFSDFGTALRRRKLYSLAFSFHERAKDLAPDDEHILFNMARVMFDAGKINQARRYLQQAVTMARGFQAGTDFLEFIDGNNMPGAGKRG